MNFDIIRKMKLLLTVATPLLRALPVLCALLAQGVAVQPLPFDADALAEIW